MRYRLPYLPLLRAGLMSLLLLAGAALRPGSASAQGAVHSVIGVVRDTAGTLVAGANITIGTRSTVSDSRGLFRVDSLRPGIYPLLVRLVGFTPVRSQVPVLPGETAELEVFLEHAPYLLPTVVVEGNRTGIYGTVGDTGFRAVVGATVQLLGTNGGAVQTDSMGRFAFPEADRGAYLVTVTFPGYTERRQSVVMRRGEGRELALFLAPTGEGALAIPGTVLQDLRLRLASGLRTERLMGADLARHQDRGLCDIPQLRSEVGETTTVLVNGTTLMREYPIHALCAWRADEVEFLEFGRDVCREVSQTVAHAMGIFCSGRARNVPRSIDGRGTSARAPAQSYVVIWEKR